MKKLYIIFNLFVALILMANHVAAQDNEYPKLTVEAADLALVPGETFALPLTGELTENPESSPVTVSVKWKVEPGYLGKFDRSGTFTARHPGEGRLTAKYKNARFSVKIVVEGTAKTDDEEDEDDYPKVKILPGFVKVEQGDFVELRGFFVNEEGEKTDVELHWSVSDGELGSFPDETQSIFQSANPGEGTITATYGDYSATVRLVVVEPKEDRENHAKKFSITPESQIVHLNPGATIEYKVISRNPNSDDWQVTWEVSNEAVATIDSETGILTLGEQTGITVVKATSGKYSATTELIVINPEMDLTVNTITVHRVLPDGTELPPKTLNEGEIYKIGGLPYPLNILNGGMLHFPFGCLHENITLYMFIPEEYAELDDENAEVSFTGEILNGIKFSVLPEGSDEIVEPYVFDIPIELSLVFKRGLLESLQISPEELDVFFADNSGFVLADENVDIDVVRNRIFAQIEHFSTIVIRPKSGMTNLNRPLNPGEMLRVFPNPFSISTNIKYELDQPTVVNLTIYNMFGRRVKQLVNDTQYAGMHRISWDGTNESGSRVPTGIYLCHFIKDGEIAHVKRIVLNH